MLDDSFAKCITSSCFMITIYLGVKTFISKIKFIDLCLFTRVRSLVFVHSCSSTRVRSLVFVHSCSFTGVKHNVYCPFSACSVLFYCYLNLCTSL